MKTEEICVLIPVHNEAKTIGALVSGLRAEGLDVIVVDDGSVDGSGKIAQDMGAICLFHESKKGKGKSLRDGFAMVLEKDYRAVVTMDGDGQHAVEDIGRFMVVAEQTNAGMITGTRMCDAREMPFLRWMTNKFMSWVISGICRQTVPDSQCGYRLIRREVLEKLRLSCSDFEIETEMLVEASQRGFGIVSVPVQTIYRNETSKINPFADTWRFCAYLIRVVLFPRK